MAACILNSVIGKLMITEDGGYITGIRFENENLPDLMPDGKTPVLKAAEEELLAYFTGKLKVFFVPVKPEGTPFMLSVWRELCRIPYGETASYGEIAKRVGSPKAARAVGMACNRNPIPLLIPCHRVVGSSGSLVGFGGGLATKQRLLDLEAGKIG